MKRFFVAVVLAVSALPAFAIDVAYLPNNNQGLMVLTDDASTCRVGLLAYATSSEGKRSLLGCWNSDELFVYLSWSGDTAPRSYVLDHFTFTKAAIARY
jgi:hypothetical protein